jgi:ribosomal protein S27E
MATTRNLRDVLNRLEGWSTLMPWAAQRSQMTRVAFADDAVRAFECHLVVQYHCPEHGFAGWALPGTSVRCRSCGRPLFAPVIDLALANIREIEALGSLAATVAHGPDHFFRIFEGKLVARFACAKHGFVAWALPGTRIRCPHCGRPLRAPVAELLFGDLQEVKPLGDD